MTYVKFATNVATLCIGLDFISNFINIKFAQGMSMLPTMDSGLYVVDKFSQNWRQWKVGDIIMFESPIERGALLCKRIAALPGDQACINPEGLEDTYCVVPKGSIWVLGDNLAYSRDSRLYGPIPINLIRGRELAKTLAL
ncbi:LexA/Signal peptidase [Rozella allomycis CSF55]|uniref:LexA/Signal peptidase n=1 Tax=Rozella allomycis (strain CSF55) TaxID=988480 RepID=A0A075APB4_ROZAC|nr:Peptidase S24/S26A/S26B/S26C, beta-ribbon domain-containing protein [Rozella allomycis CSF55]RKP21095.1 LexA/Signal peptidase [Rozella allomycis CSF55]|eukprot:EPZ31901.1 Peptidase S24/S26A/S26B/S26C, beta-ribbon domain-containing protein [Rozella allomycis CSF55]